MKRRVSVIFMILAVAVAVVPHGSKAFQSEERRQRNRQEVERERDRSRDHDSDSQGDLLEREETKQSYELSRGARVEVSGINGSVEIETGNVNSAEVHIIRSANDRADLEYRKIIVEHTPDSLVVRGEKDRERNSAGRNRQVRQRVMMKIPRQVDLVASGVNGRVNVGAVDGPVKVSGVNGKVDVAQARGYSHISGINGKVSITITELGERGIHVSGINGGVELQFAEELNADLDVSGVNGTVSPEVANVTIQGKLERGNFRAKIGSGGSSISVSGVNGRVRLSRVGATG